MGFSSIGGNRRGRHRLVSLLDLAAVAGTLGGILSVGAFLPQAYRIWSRRSAGDISLTMYLAIVIASALWMFYAYAYSATALLLTNAIIGVIALVIAALRIRYGG
jgi:MtN3 and saliva related transmembrane protein